MYSALTAHAERATDAVPSVVATGVAMIVLQILCESAVGQRASARPADDSCWEARRPSA